MPLSEKAYAYEAIIWVKVENRYVVKCGFKAHHLSVATDYASLYARSVTDDSGYVTIRDLINNKELNRIPLGKAQAAVA